ncbi:ParA family protein [Bifidobacterium xylocopae]|nr:ParA family protein [Bifidobacterium xylocopae]
MAHFITIANTKGGVGKTTSTMLISQELVKRGKKVEVRDTDPSGGATKWKILAKESGTPLPFPVRSANIAEVGEDPDDPDTWVIIDTPPLQAEIIQAAIDAADLVIITTQPGRLDLQRTIDTAKAVGKPLTILATHVIARSRSWQQLQEELTKAGLSQMKAYIPSREAIKNATGTSDLPHGTRYDEVVQEILDAFSE